MAENRILWRRGTDQTLIGRIGQSRVRAFVIFRPLFERQDGKPYILKCFLPGQPGETPCRDEQMAREQAEAMLTDFLEGIS